jgi:hypothetical protein
MGTLSFFESILPASGIKLLAELVPYTDKATGKQKDGWRYFKFESLDAMAVAVEQFEAKGLTVFHACHAYGDWYRDEAYNKNRIRTAVNVVSCRSLFDDVDCGKRIPLTPEEKAEGVDPESKPFDTNYYITKKEAAAAIKGFVAATGLPMPMVIDSGGGLHLYWPMTEDVAPQEWSHLSAMKRRVTRHLGLKVDRAVDMDLARVLRPVGSFNKKREQPAEVKQKNNPQPSTPSNLRAALEKYIKENNVPAEKESVKRSTNPFAICLERDFPPSHADIVAEHCAVIKWFKETGAPDEPLWHKCIGAIKDCVDGEERIHEWSALYAGYSAEETQSKIELWSYDPTLCSTFRGLTELCNDCTKKCKNPIQLGYQEQTKCEVPQDEAPAQEPPSSRALSTEELLKKIWPQRYSMENNRMSASVQDPDGVWSNAPFCDTVFYPIDLTQGEDGAWNALIEYHTQYGKKRQFTLAASDISSADKLCSALAGHTIWIYNNKSARMHVSEYMRKLCIGLQAHKREQKTEKAFGWTEDFSGFVIGNTMVTQKGDHPVLLSKNVESSGMAKDFGMAGTRHQWVSLVDDIYNRPGAEMYQFAFLVAAASPLIKLAGIQGFHGIPVAYTGKGGRGKTTMCRMACSIWGNGENFIQSSNPSGSTINAMIGRVGIMRNLPWVMDELTGQAAEQIGDMAYALSNGKPKDRLTSGGSFANSNITWDLFTFLTGNYDITELLATLDKQKSDAVQVRCFEIKVPDDFNETVFAGMDAKSLIDEGLQNNFGVVGRELLEFYFEKRNAIVRNIHSMRQKYVPNTADETRERFYIDLIVFAIVAGHIMRKLGLVRFDIDAIRKWAFDNVKRLRHARADKNYTEEELIGHLISDMHGKTLITRRVRDGRSGDKEVPMEQLRGPIYARMAVDDKKFYITSKGINEWCKDSGYLPSNIKDLLDKFKYIVHVKGRDKYGAFNMQLGVGTTVPLGVSRCIELDYAKVMGHETSIGKTASVTPISAASVVNAVAEDVAATA